MGELIAELGEVEGDWGDLVLAPGAPRAAAWAQNTWYDPVRIGIRSIRDAVKALRSIQRDWVLYSTALRRRAHLIEEQLPRIEVRPLAFPCALPPSKLGAWTLLDAGTLLASARTSSPFPNGAVSFVENKHGPPNRAYLKLWEAWATVGRWPKPGERCVDLGASPGGWTWALAQLGARVISVDKARLAPRVAALDGVEFRAASAFALDPDDVGPIDWLCSDVICYPARLLRLVERWLDSGQCRNFVCTIKFQGATDRAAMRRFAEIPGSRLMHLSRNKHELTWARLAAPAP